MSSTHKVKQIETELSDFLDFLISVDAIVSLPKEERDKIIDRIKNRDIRRIVSSLVSYIHNSLHSTYQHDEE